MLSSHGSRTWIIKRLSRRGLSIFIFTAATAATSLEAGVVLFGESTDQFRPARGTTLGTDVTYEANVLLLPTSLISDPAPSAPGEIFRELTTGTEHKFLNADNNEIRAFGFAASLPQTGLIGTATISESSRDLGENWHHIAYVQNSSAQTQNIYLDGILVTSRSITAANIADSTGNMAFGAATFGGIARYAFRGAIDSFRISNAALYSGTSTTTANFSVPSGDLSLTGSTAVLYNFNEGTGTSTREEVSNLLLPFNPNTGAGFTSPSLHADAEGVFAYFDPPSAVPEPVGTTSVLLSGGFLVAFLGWRRRRSTAR